MINQRKNNIPSCKTSGFTWQLFTLALSAAFGYEFHYDNSFPNRLPKESKYTLSSEPIIINSPNYPKNYNTTNDAAYHLDGKGSPIRVVSEEISMRERDNTGRCQGDVLYIWDVKYTSAAIHVFCGTTPFDIVSYSDALIIVLKCQDFPNPAHKFSLQASRTDCGQIDLRCPSNTTKCVANRKICDGVQDCPNGEDEICSLACGKPVGIIDTASVPSSVLVTQSLTNEKAWPWHASIFTPTGPCAASLIAPQWIATAGRCCSQSGTAFLPGAVSVSVQVPKCGAAANEVRPLAQTVYLHPNYSATRIRNDFCLIKLNSSVQISDKVLPICLPLPSIIPSPGHTGYSATCTYTNSTTVLSNTLFRQISQEVLSTSACREMVRTAPEHLCANGKDTCQEDNGGPFVTPIPNKGNQWQLVGVTSTKESCTKNEPAIYTRVRQMLPFIIETVTKNNREGWYTDTKVDPVTEETDDWRHEDRKEIYFFSPTDDFQAKDTSGQTNTSLLEKANWIILLCMNCSFILLLVSGF